MEKHFNQNEFYIHDLTGKIHKGDCLLLKSEEREKYKKILEAHNCEDALKLGKLYISDAKECPSCCVKKNS